MAGVSEALTLCGEQERSAMRYLVIGAGALGSVFGGFLARAGQDVTLVGRERHIARIRERGLDISGIWGEHLVKMENLFTDTAALRGETFDAVLMCVKSYDTMQAVRDAALLVGTESVVVSLQNGLGNVETIAEVVGWDRTVGGRVIFGVEFVEPGSVKITVYAEEVMLGSPRQQVKRERIERIVTDFTAAGIPTLYTDEIEKYIWSKVLYNCALNPLATILRTHYGSLLEQEETRTLMHDVLKEVFEVARAHGVKLFWERYEDYVALLFSRLIPATHEHHPSMLQDISRGKRTEIDALNGAVCTLAEKVGIAVPLNSTIRHIVKTMESLAATQ
jgi:2-dehydropantoate 2-reductase